MLWLIVALLFVIAFLLFLMLLDMNASKDILVKIINHLEGHGLTQRKRGDSE